MFKIHKNNIKLYLTTDDLALIGAPCMFQNAEYTGACFWYQSSSSQPQELSTSWSLSSRS